MVQRFKSVVGNRLNERVSASAGNVINRIGIDTNGFRSAVKNGKTRTGKISMAKFYQ
jgi:hypothetical protein